MLDYRYIARIIIEAETPLAVGTGEQGILCDDLVAADMNGLPCIHGSSLCGVLRHSLEASSWNHTKENHVSLLEEIFGYQKESGGHASYSDGMGSRLIISDAVMLNASGCPMDGIQTPDRNDPYLKNFSDLPIRQHCRIDHQGVADTEKYGKFDNEVVYKGTRFVFEIELMGYETDHENWIQLLSQFTTPSFRVGGGTRKGYGKLKIISCQQREYDLKKADDRNAFLNKSSRLDTEFEGSKEFDIPESDCGWNLYKLTIEPEDFFLFASGFGDTETDITPAYEPIIEWSPSGDSCAFSEEKILIPASSIKGALAHRVAFHYNRLTKEFSDKKSREELQMLCGENNTAVRALFGAAKDSKRKIDRGQIGKILSSDLFLKKKTEQIFNHVSIDRFTGGALDAALFNEKVSSGEQFVLEFLVDPSAWKEDQNIRHAFEHALQDICDGALPLGGGVMRGHGCFQGTMSRNGEEVHHDN